MIDPAFASFPIQPRWHYDVLRGLDYLRSAGSPPDDRIAEALDLVNQNRGDDGRWPLQNTHPGPVHFDMDEGDGIAQSMEHLAGDAGDELGPQCWPVCPRGLGASEVHEQPNSIAAGRWKWFAGFDDGLGDSGRQERNRECKSLEEIRTA